MTVETTVDYIDDLNASYPAEDEVGTLHEGNDHLRNIKKAIKQTFPNITGAVLPTDAELNYVDGVTSNLQAQLNTLSGVAYGAYFPSGTRMLFHQNTAPTGWVKETNAYYNDRALRVVIGSRVDGGYYGMSAMFDYRTTTSTALSEAQIPYHQHTMQHQHGTTSGNFLLGNDGGAVPGYAGGSYYSPIGAASVTGYATNATTSAVGGSQGHTHNLEMRLAYTDIIIAQKS